MQRLQRVPTALLYAGGLLPYDLVGTARDAGEAYDERRFELIQDILVQAQGIHDRATIGQEFNEIDATEGRRVLVLLPTGKPEILTLDVVRQTGNVIATERQFQVRAIRFYQRDDERRRGP